VGNLIFMSGNPLIVATEKGSDPETVFCDGCGEERKRVDLMKCKGCESAWYCKKVSASASLKIRADQMIGMSEEGLE